MLITFVEFSFFNEKFATFFAPNSYICQNNKKLMKL